MTRENNAIADEKMSFPDLLYSAGFSDWEDYNDYFGYPAENRLKNYKGELVTSGFRFAHNDPNYRHRA